VKVLVNVAGWELSSEAEDQTPEAPALDGERPTSANKVSSGVFAKASRAAAFGDHSPESFSPTEPAPPSDDPEAADVTLPPPPSLPKI